jgi:hypothetical protein
VDGMRGEVGETHWSGNDTTGPCDSKARGGGHGTPHLYQPGKIMRERKV